MSDSATPWIWATAILATVGYIAPRWERSVPVAPVDVHEQTCSCDAELRQLFELKDLVEWYRLLVLALAAAALLLAAALACLGACWCGCLPGCRRSPAAPVRPAEVPKRADATLLALLASQEVRCPPSSTSRRSW
jgi:hypothetical protein